MQVEHPAERRHHVVYDMTLADKSTTGTRIYAYGLQAAVRALDRWQVTTVAAPTRTGYRVARRNLNTGLESMLWMHLVLPHKVRSLHADLLHASAYSSPLRLGCPAVVNVFDTIYHDVPQNYDAKWRLYTRLFVGPTVRRAAAIVTISRHSRDRIQEVYGVPAERVHVIYPGISDRFRADHGAAAIAAVRAKYGLGSSYCLFVGATEKRKNVRALVLAMARLKAHGCLPGLQLVLVGPPSSGWQETLLAIRQHQLGAVVVNLGYVIAADLPLIYAGASLFVFPSSREGFGMPLIEAMASGVPIVTTANPPMPEVVGDAAWFSPGAEPEALAKAIQDVLEKPILAQALREKGLARARQFTWEQAGERTVAVYDQVVSAAPRVN